MYNILEKVVQNPEYCTVVKIWYRYEKSKIGHGDSSSSDVKFSFGWINIKHASWSMKTIFEKMRFIEPSGRRSEIIF